MANDQRATNLPVTVREADPRHGPPHDRIGPSGYYVSSGHARSVAVPDTSEPLARRLLHAVGELLFTSGFTVGAEPGAAARRVTLELREDRDG